MMAMAGEPPHGRQRVTRAEDQDRRLAELVERAREGRRDALEQLVRAIQDPIYGLALRMLGVAADAEDAAQEILIKVITRLDSFRGESRFTTWVYAVAANHLRDVKTSAWERRRRSFEQMAESQDNWLPGAAPPAVEQQVLTREIRLLCLHGLLVCLDRESRLTFLLGDTFELSGAEGAQVLGIEPAAFRKRLSRARDRLLGFLKEHCGLVRPGARCRCELWCDPAVKMGVVDPDRLQFATQPAAGVDDRDLEARLGALDELARIGALFRTLPDYRAPGRLLDELSATLELPRSPTA
jgi:RNA polymerase sigma factor (sigma-70 family)